MKKYFLEQNTKKYIIISMVVSVIALAGMDIFLFPAVKAAAGGIAAFDLQAFAYNKEVGQAFLKNITAAGKTYYYAAIALDFIFMFAYTYLFLALFIRLNKTGYKLVFLPIALFAVDVIEDVMSIIMLKTNRFIPFASTVSATKNILTYACGAVVLVFLIMRLIRKKKNRQT